LTFDWFKDSVTPSDEVSDDPIGNEIKVCLPEVKVLKSSLSLQYPTILLLRISFR